MVGLSAGFLLIVMATGLDRRRASSIKRDLGYIASTGKIPDMHNSATRKRYEKYGNQGLWAVKTKALKNYPGDYAITGTRLTAKGKRVLEQSKKTLASKRDNCSSRKRGGK
jgi:predicted lipase